MFKKPVIQEYEQEFSVKQLENRHVFYDIYLKVDDVQELRGRVAEELTDKDYKILLNETTKFEENSELEEVFRGGNTKPVRIVIKAAKDRNAGPVYPKAWKAFLILSIILFAITLAYSRSAFYQAFNSTYTTHPSSFLVYATLGSFILFLVFLLFRYVVPMYVWVKIIGILEPNANANVRVVLAGECQFKDKESYAELEEDLSEVYYDLTRHYVRAKISKDAMLQSIPFRSENSRRLMDRLRDIEKQLSDLERNFAAGKISEDSYKQLRSELEQKKAQVEALLDVVMP
jgi:hypothetical protein